MKTDQPLSVQPQSGSIWFNFILQFTAWAGALCLVSGVLFFFAYNWEELGRFAKFALVQVAIVISVAVYLLIKKKMSLARPWVLAVSITAVAILLGVALALVGQTYQTGADPWQLFAIWSLLILPLLLVGQTQVLWILWGGLLNLALSLYLDVESELLGVSTRSINQLWFFVLLNSILVLILETLAYLAKKYSSIAFAQARIAVRIFVIATIIPLTMMFMWSVLEFHAQDTFFLELIEKPSLVLYPVFIGFAVFLYQKVHLDLLLLAALALSIIISLTTLVSHIWNEYLDISSFLAMALVLLVSSSLAVSWLRSLQTNASSAGDKA